MADSIVFPVAFSPSREAGSGEMGEFAADFIFFAPPPS